LIGRGIADDSGYIDLQLFEPVDSADTITLSVLAHNRYRYTQEIPVIQDQPFIAFNLVAFSDQAGNNNGLLDYGEVITTSVEMKNIGDQPAENINVLLETGNEFVTVDDNEEMYGNFLPEEAITMNNAFSFTIDSLSPWQTASFSLNAINGAYDFTSSFIGIIHAPELKFKSFTINDQSGNNNGKIDPGETADLMITICNSGSSEAFNVNGLLETDCNYITFNQSDLLFGDLEAGNESTSSFSITASDDCPDGTVAFFDLMIMATGGITASDSIEIFIGQPPIAILDLDQNRNSGPAIYDAIMENGIGAEYFTNWTNDIDDYEAVFVCLGIFWNNHKLTNDEGDRLATYLANGGNLYLEGGSTWWYDYQTSVHPFFNIQSDFGTLELNDIVGMGGTMTENMSFEYVGDSLYWDNLSPIEPAFMILENDEPYQGVGVAYDAGIYRTIGTSVEFGGLKDGTSPSTKKELMMQYLDFFEILNSTVGISESYAEAEELKFTVRPNPVMDIATISWKMEEAGIVDISVFSMNGKKVGTLWSGGKSAGVHSQPIDLGNLLQRGIYFVRMTTETATATEKVVIF
jgi:hypothetical protein